MDRGIELFKIGSKRGLRPIPAPIRDDETYDEPEIDQSSMYKVNF